MAARREPWRSNTEFRGGPTAGIPAAGFGKKKKMIYFLFITLVVLGLVTLLFVRKSENLGRGKAVLGALALFAVVGGIGALLVLQFAPKSKRISESDGARLFASHGFAVADTLKKGYEKERIVVLFRNSDEGERSRLFLDAVKSVLGSETPLEPVFITPQKEDSDSTFKFLVTAKDFDRENAPVKGAGVVIVAADLPRDIGRMALWRNTPAAKIFVLDADRPLAEPLKRKLIAGYTIFDPHCNPALTNIPTEYGKAFSSRYKLVTQ